MITSINCIYEAQDKKIFLWIEKDSDELKFSFDKLIGFPIDLQELIKENKPFVKEILEYNQIDSEKKARKTHNLFCRA